MPMILLLVALAAGTESPAHPVDLPRPSLDGATAVEEALGRRRSVRSYAASPLSLREISQLVWAAQGVTGAEGGRTAPSAGATYPLEILVIAGAVDDLVPGAYRYRPEYHRLDPARPGDLRAEVAAAAGSQAWIRAAPAILVVTAVEARTAVRYGSRARRYVHMEVGCAAENLYLQATAIGLGTTLVGAFDDDRVARILKLASGEEPLALLPVGRLR